MTTYSSADVSNRDLRALRDRVAVAGVGWTQFSRSSGRTTTSMAVEAITAALADAGLERSDVDGLATHHVRDSAALHEVTPALGIDDLAWFDEEFGGGSRAAVIVGHAATAVAAGLADCVVVYRSLNGRTGTRMGASGGERTLLSSDLQFSQPYGLLAAAASYAIGARMHMIRYGTTADQLGAVAVTQRANAVENERALMRTPITLEDHRSSRMIADPFRLLDCCLETDVACAIVLTTVERARDLRQPVVTLKGWASAIGPGDLDHPGGDLTRSTSSLVAPRLYAMAGLGPEDVDVAELYDAFSFAVLLHLEDYGFCAKGEAGPFVASGAIARTGSLPVNTHGGFLSEGYAHGLNHVCEAVSQLRGQAGTRQVEGAEIALATAMPGYPTGASGAVLLGRS